MKRKISFHDKNISFHEKNFQSNNTISNEERNFSLK